MATLHTVGEKAMDLGRTAGQKIEAAKAGTGTVLHSAASKVRNGSAALDNVANGAANRLDATGTFVESCSMKNAMQGLANFGRSHFTGTMMLAVAAGFVLGSALRHSVRSNQPVMESN